MAVKPAALNNFMKGHHPPSLQLIVTKEGGRSLVKYFVGMRIKKEVFVSPIQLEFNIWLCWLVAGTW